MLRNGSMLAAVAGIVIGPSVFAQDIGALEKRVRALEQSGGAQIVNRSKKTMKLVVSGHINRLIQFRDNGTKSGIIHATSQESRTRVRWVGTGKINDDLTLGTYIELGNQSAISTAQDLGDNTDQGNNGGNALDERFLDLSITSKTLGKIYIGQGSSGSESTSERDLSGTGLLSLNGAEFLVAGSEVFQSNSIDDKNTGISVGSVMSNFDGLGRRDRIRYDTPKYAGFQITASHANGDVWDVALRYGGSIGSVKMTGAIAYSDTETVNGRSVVNGSFSILLPVGLSFTVAGADQDDTAGGASDSTDWVYGKIGYKFTALDIGQSRLYASWGEVDDRGGLGNEATAISVGLVQIIQPLGLEFQLGYVNFDVDLGSGVQTDSIDVVTVGLRAKF
jgi:hypothetical protein